MWIVLLLILTAIYFIFILVSALLNVSDKFIETFPPLEHLRNLKGYNFMKNKTITYGGLARNSAVAFEQNIANIEKWAKYFKSVNVAILENDSEDGTRKLYFDYINNNTNPRINIKLVNNGQINHCPVYTANLPRSYTGDVGFTRINKMVNLRNDLIKSIKNVFPNTDYVYISDMDIRGEIFLDGIANSFSYFQEDPNIDAITHMGVSKKLFTSVFDPYAYNAIDDKDVRKETKYKIAKPSFFSDPTIHKGLYRVKSNFSGGFLAKKEALDKSQYIYRGSDNKSECEHVSFFENLNTYVNTSMVRYIDSHVS